MSSRFFEGLILGVGLMVQAHAQNHTTNHSVDTRPGTSAPDSHAGPPLPSTSTSNSTVQAGILGSPVTNEIEKDAGSAKADREASRRNQQKQELRRPGRTLRDLDATDFSNERERRFSPGSE